MLLDMDRRGYSWINESIMSVESQYMNLNTIWSFIFTLHIIRDPYRLTKFNFFPCTHVELSVLER